MPPRKAPAAAKRKPVDDATLWVVEHAAAVGIDNDVLLDLLDAAKGATRSGEMPARIAQRLSLQMLSDAVEKKEPVSAKTCKLLAKLAPLESLTDDSEELEPRVRMCAEAACLARSKGWPAFKLAIDDMFPPRVNLAKLAKAARDDLLSAHKRCKSPGASEKPFNAARKKHGAHKADSAAARKDLASVVSAHAATLGSTSLQRLIEDITAGAYIPPPGVPKATLAGVRVGSPGTRRAAAAADDDGGGGATGGERRKSMLRTPTKKTKNKRAREEEEAVEIEKADDDAGDEDDVYAPPADDAGDPWNRLAMAAVSPSPSQKKKQKEALAKVVAASPAAKRAKIGAGEPKPSTPVGRVVNALAPGLWRRRALGLAKEPEHKRFNSDGEEEEEEDDDDDAFGIMPTQVAPTEEDLEAEAKSKSAKQPGFLSRVFGGRKKDADAAGTLAEDADYAPPGGGGGSSSDDDDDDDDESLKKRLLASPGGGFYGGTPRKSRGGPPLIPKPLGVANRHSNARGGTIKAARSAGNTPGGSTPGGAGGGAGIAPQKKERTPWAEDDVDFLLEGYEKFGPDGEDSKTLWADILIAGMKQNLFKDRTSMDLKDKYRNIKIKRAREAANALEEEEEGGGGLWTLIAGKKRRRRSMNKIKNAITGELERRPGKANRHSNFAHTSGVTQEGVRKMRQRWTAEEEDCLRKGMAEFNPPGKEGPTDWISILDKYDTVMIDRTSMDLKDKWRNMKKKMDKERADRIAAALADAGEEASS